MSSGTQARVAPPAARPSRFLPYAQLVRLPNVVTAMADITLAALVTGSLPGQVLPFLLLLGALVLRWLWRKECWTPPWLILYASMLAVIATALIFCGEPRYRDANMPVLMIYAALGALPWRFAILTNDN